MSMHGQPRQPETVRITVWGRASTTLVQLITTCSYALLEPGIRLTEKEHDLPVLLLWPWPTDWYFAGGPGRMPLRVAKFSVQWPDNGIQLWPGLSS